MFSWSKSIDSTYQIEHPACAGCGEEEGWGEIFTLVGRDYFCDGCKAQQNLKEAAE